MASCYVPLIFESPVKINNRFFVTGDLTNPMPTLHDRTITVSAYNDTSDIGPAETYSLADRLSLFSGGDIWEMTSGFFKDGYLDANSWIQTELGQSHPLILKQNETFLD